MEPNLTWAEYQSTSTGAASIWHLLNKQPPQGLGLGGLWVYLGILCLVLVFGFSWGVGEGLVLNISMLKNKTP